MIVSGGQTGVDRGAWDCAIELGIPYGGWIPHARRAEDGKIPDTYVGLNEHPSFAYADRTYANVRDSDATLIIKETDELGPGSKQTVKFAVKLNREFLIIDIRWPDACEKTRSWLASVSPMLLPIDFKLNVAGSGESRCPGIQVRTKEFLKRVLV